MSFRSRLLYFVFPSLLAMLLSLYLAIVYIVEREVSMDAELLADQHLEAVRMLHGEHVKVLAARVTYMADVPMLKALVAEHLKKQIHVFLENTFHLPDGVLYAVYDANNQLLDTSSDLLVKRPMSCEVNGDSRCERVLEMGGQLYQVVEVEIASHTQVWGYLMVAFALNDHVLGELQHMTEFCDISLVSPDGQRVFSSTLDVRARNDLHHFTSQEVFSKHDLDTLSQVSSILLDEVPYVLRGFSLNEGEDREVGYLLIHQSLESVGNILNRVASFFAIIGCTLLFIIFMIDVILVKSVLKPLNDLVDSISSLGVRDRQLKIKTPKIKEVAYVVSAINAMLQEVFEKTEQLSRSEKQYRSLITHANDAIISVDHNHHICVWNQQAEHLFGYGESDAMNLNITDIFPSSPDMLQMKECSVRAYHKNGMTVPVEVTISKSIAADDILYTAVVRDMRAQIKARERDQLLLQAIHHSSDMIMISDCNSVIEYVNPALEKVTGYRLEELKGKAAAIFNSGKQSAAFYQEMWNIIRNGQVWKGKLINRRKNGEFYTEEMSISPVLDANANITHFVAVKRDISEQEKLEEKIEHSQRLESLGVLAGGIAHDFNNLLTAIMGTASLLRFQVEDDSPQVPMLDRIEQSSQRAADLCKQMLAYSGKGKFEIRPICLSEVVANLIDLLQVSVEKNIHMQLELSDDLPLVNADVSQIQQIVMNLVINASEAVEKGHGFIRVETGVVYANQAILSDTWLDEHLKEGRYVYLDVADNGCGMNEEVQQKLFDPFFTTKFTGRGLGMSAILGIVRGHHGTIRVQSEVGEGTTFTVLLPVQDIPVVAIEKEESMEVQVWQGSGTVLLVDDEEVIRKVVKAMLENMGFDVVLACNGHQALELYDTHLDDICLVLLDLTMPVMDGLSCFKALRQKSQEIKVLISSGYSSQEIGDILTQDKHIGFIQKPYIMKALRDKLQAFLES